MQPCMIKSVCLQIISQRSMISDRRLWQMGHNQRRLLSVFAQEYDELSAHHPQHCPCDVCKSSPVQPPSKSCAQPPFKSHAQPCSKSHAQTLSDDQPPSESDDQPPSISDTQHISKSLAQDVSESDDQKTSNNSPQRIVKAYSLLATSDKHK